MAVRRHLTTGEVVDLVYGYDLSVKVERDRWNIYVLKPKPKVIIMVCFPNLNKKYQGFAEGYAISRELAIFAAEMAWIQLTNGRDLRTESHRKVNSGSCHVG